MRDVLPYALWITPHFTREMELGITPPPFVNHDTIDWEDLLSSLEAKFQAANQGVKMRIANDTIDQVTIHARETGAMNGTIECLEFGAALQAKAKNSKKKIVPIQDEWRSLHAIPDRQQAPPPIMIPLILSGQVEDIILFTRNIQLHLGIKAAADIMAMFQQTPLPEDSYQGHLPQDLMDLFESHFGVGYQSYSVITPLVKINPATI